MIGDPQLMRMMLLQLMQQGQFGATDQMGMAPMEPMGASRHVMQPTIPLTPTQSQRMPTMTGGYNAMGGGGGARIPNMSGSMTPGSQLGKTPIPIPISKKQRPHTDSQFDPDPFLNSAF